MSVVRVGICADFREEGWPSMDRIADALVSLLDGPAGRAAGVEVTRICPPFVRRASRVSSGPRARNVDRGLNRLLDYPRHVARLSSSYDVYHVVDHSYSQLVHRLPAGKTVVTCHDLDTFRSLLDPGAERRSAAFRAMTRHILSGLGRAALVTCDTAAVRRELIERGIVDEPRSVVVPLGVAECFATEPDQSADRAAVRLMAAPGASVTLLHVGSAIPRKRLDVALRCLAAVRHAGWPAHLIRVGGPLTADQQRIVAEEGLGPHVSIVPVLDDRQLAAVYRRAGVVLLPSEREGFGLPVVEALACGAPVVASDVPALREVGGDAVEFCPVGDLDSWTSTVVSILSERVQPGRAAARRDRGLAVARRFTWPAFAERMARIYLSIAGRPASEAGSPVMHVA
jgi:glycosyltransferase involved in cell wall biosynthesis